MRECWNRVGFYMDDVWMLCHEVIVLVCFFYGGGRIAS